MLPSDVPPPPVAPRRPTLHAAHGDAREDDWQWLGNRDDPAVLALPRAENSYAEAVLAPTQALQGQLFEQIRARMAETDISTPVFHTAGGTGPGTSPAGNTPSIAGVPTRAAPCRRRRYWRRPEQPCPGPGWRGTAHRRPKPTAGDGAAVAEPGRAILDENELAGGSDYFALGVFDIRPDQDVLAYAVRLRRLGALHPALPGPRVGRRPRRRGRRRPLRLGVVDQRQELLLRPARQGHAAMAGVAPHRWALPRPSDQLVYQEDDERFFVSVGLTRSKRFVLIRTESKMSSEVHYLKADKERGHPRSCCPGGRASSTTSSTLVIPTRAATCGLCGRTTGPAARSCDNFAVFELAVGETEIGALRPLLPYRPVGKGRVGGRFCPSHPRPGAGERASSNCGSCAWWTASEHVIPQPEPAYTLAIEGTPEWDTDVARFGYSSLVSPPSSVDYDMERRRRAVVKRSTVGGGYRRLRLPQRTHLGGGA